MMINNKRAVLIATLGPIGYLPAPGTVATLLTLPIIYFLQHQIGMVAAYSAIVSVCFFIARFIVAHACAHLQQDDPGQIVLDEVLGCLITFSGVSLNAENILIGVSLFRLLDITKCMGIGRLEKYGNGWGVMLDDAAAGIITNIIVRLVIHYYA
jgi:phosphatidylglycerophosphatase A